MKIACHCSWASGSNHAFLIKDANDQTEAEGKDAVPQAAPHIPVPGLFKAPICTKVDVTMNEDVPDADLVVDVGDLFTVASSKYPSKRRAYASTEPSIFMGYENGDLAKRMADYYGGFIFTWHPELLHLPQRRPFYFGNSWVTWQPSPKKFGVGAIFSGKSQCVKAEGYALRRQVMDAEYSILVPSMFYGPKGGWKGTPFQYPLPSKQPSLEWMFHVSIENHAEAEYFTEKLMDPIMDGCVPIYYGDPQIGKIFDMRGIILLDQKNIAGQINNLTEKDYWYRKPFMDENRKRAERFLDVRLQIAETVAGKAK